MFVVATRPQRALAQLRTQPPAAASASATRFDISSGGTSSTWVATFH